MPTKAESYANALYEVFANNAEQVQVGDITVNRWVGFITEECRKIGVPVGTERRITRPLEEMGCIQVLQKGVSNHPTVLALHHAPTDELWKEQRGSLTSRPTLARLAAEVENVKRQMGGVDLVEAITNLDDRLKTLEAESGHKSTKSQRGNSGSKSK